MDQVKIPDWLKVHYPFGLKSLEISGNRYSYVDEGEGPVVVLLHGNPTWSFYYRNLIKSLKKNHRVIVPDHLGCGLSDKPQGYSYQLKDHVQNVKTLLDFLEIGDFSLVVHDWGGAIGMGVATSRPHQVKKIVLTNTAAFLSKRIPRRIQMCRQGRFGEFLVRRLNGFALPATFMTTVTPLNREIKKAYLYPYSNYRDRVAVSRFVQDIPMEGGHPSRAYLSGIEQKLPELKCPKMIIWGGKDFCFNDSFYLKWKEIYPDALTHYFQDAGHYVLEDKKNECEDLIGEFLS